MAKDPVRKAKLLAIVTALMGLALVALSSVASAQTAPVITGFTPDRGGVGVQVTISGSGFTGATEVDFGTASATFSVVDDSTIDARYATASSARRCY